MPRKQKTIHYLYKTTCLVTEKYYVGMHSTINLEDGYMGSGKRLRFSIRKYGVENHKKDILEFFDSRELLIEAEINVINNNLLDDEMCMNLKEGGTGGFTSEQQKLNNKKSQERQKWLTENDKVWLLKKSKSITEGNKKQYDNGLRDRVYFYDWNGKSHKEETKKLIGDKNSKHQKGNKNSQFGTCWITNGIDNKKIKKESIVPNGWYLGRV